MTNATLVTMSGAVKVTRGELVKLSTPLPTASHTPVAHAMMVDLVEMRLKAHSMVIRHEEYAVQSDGNKLFGTITLQHQTREDFSFAIGLRTSNDKTLPVQMVAGSRVFVCDNLVFSGEAITIDRKHTSRLNIRHEVFGGIDKAIAKFDILDNRIQELKVTEITDDHAQAMMLQAALSGVMPLRLLPDVNKNYFQPPHAEFEPRTEWSLHNAFTESFKGLRTNIAMEANMELGRMFAI